MSSVEKRKKVYGVLKISGHPPESEEKMFTLGACKGHHLHTAHGEEHPKGGIFTVILVSCGSDS